MTTGLHVSTLLYRIEEYILQKWCKCFPGGSMCVKSSKVRKAL